ncbi:MAG: hypothetical protein HQL42_19395 [Alphaproteobacteria bacterium]|nr:hypothetical protein [Alphaproteobacteria bacterium]
MSFIVGLSVIALLVANPALCADTERKAGQDYAREFHAAQTDAEIRLDAILKQADSIAGSSWVAVQAPWRDKANDRLFEGMFSPTLQAAWVRAEQDAVRKNCTGAYIDGELCGIDIHPITCAQDLTPNYQYRTASSTSNQAIIEYRWGGGTKTMATFRLIRADRSWVLDGVACTGYLKFNMR